MKLKMDMVGSRDSCRRFLVDEIEKIDEETRKERELEKEEIRKKILFSDEELKEIAHSLSGVSEVYFYFDKDTKDDQFEDDGSIHVRRKGVRFVKDGRKSGLTSFANKVEKLMNELIEERFKRTMKDFTDMKKLKEKIIA